jgi:hypothetical protein
LPGVPLGLPAAPPGRPAFLAEPPGLPPVAVDLPDFTTLTWRFSPGVLTLIECL